MRRFVIGIVAVGLTLAVVSPAFATGKQVICWTQSGGNYIPFWGNSYDGMRFQTLIPKAQINYAGKINQVEYNNSSARAGTFNNYKLYLCHTDKTALLTTFASNYKGTPVKVADLSAFNISGAAGWFPLGMTATTFDYNNTDNLLVEIQWQGDNGQGVPIYRSSIQSSNHRIWAYNNPTAPTGSGDGCPYWTRLSFGAYTGVSPTSLGRVKAMFE